MLRASAPEALLRRMLWEIDETVLPRQLIFGTREGGTVTLAAGNRRLLRIESASGPGMDAHAELAGQGFEPGTPGVAEEIRALLEKLIEGADTVFVRQDTHSEPIDPERAGLSATALAESWGIDLAGSEGSAPGDAIDTFLGSAQSAVLAWLMTGPETPETEGAGEPGAVDELAAFAEARRETGEALRQARTENGETWTFLSLHRAPGAPETTVIISVEGILLYLAIPRDKLGDVADAWRAAAG